MKVWKYPPKVKTQDYGGSNVPCPDADNCKECGQWDSVLTKERLCADCNTPDAKVKAAKRRIQAGESKGIVYCEDMGIAGLQKGKLK